MEGILTYKGAVMTWECDSNRHMNVMYYINKFEHAGRHFDTELQLNGVGKNKDMGIVVLEQNIKYLKEVFEDDLLYIKSTLLKLGNKAITVRHDMYHTRKEELVATMNIVIVPFDKVARKSLPFPADRREILIKRWNLES